MLSHLCRVFTIVHLKPTMFLGYTVLQMFCSYNALYAISHVQCFVLPYQHLPKYVCSAQCVYFFLVPWFHAFPVCCSGIIWMIWRWLQSPSYYRYHFCFYLPHALNFDCEVFIFWNVLSFFRYHFFPPLKLQRLLTIYFLFFIITDYDVRFIVMNGSVGLNFLFL